MSRIIAHGYVGVRAPDLGAWRTLATEVLGAAVNPGSSDDRLLLRIDERAWRIAVEVGAGGLAYCGWEVAGADELALLADDLERHGVAYREDHDLAAQRAVKGLLVTHDPAGNQVEFFHGASVLREPFRSPTGARFVTNGPGVGEIGFGHSVMTVPNLDEAQHFYFDVLGLRLSDTITLDLGTHQLVLYFAHVNARHHSLAFVQGPPDRSVFDHFSLEVEDLDMVGRALDQVLAREIPIQQTLGKHTNDHMVSFYLQTPSGFMVEYGTGGRLVDDSTWTTVDYDAASLWGHRFRADLRPS